MAADKDLVGGVARTIFSELRESEDERIRKCVLACIENAPSDCCMEVSRMEMRDWLEKQKEQMPAEWSEVDERKRLACIETINEVIDYERERWEDYNPGKPYRPIMKYDEQIDWLESLRPSWKPTYEQLEALRKAVNKLADTEVADSVRLSIMYDHLKELI